MASNGILHTTKGGGNTREPVSDKEIYADRLYFLDENIGLAMSWSVLQITTNGGKDWKLLVYPIDDF